MKNKNLYILIFFIILVFTVYRFIDFTKLVNGQRNNNGYKSNVLVPETISISVTKTNNLILNVLQSTSSNRNLVTNNTFISNFNPAHTNYVCIVLTSIKTFFERGQIVWNTWAKNCNKTLFTFNSTGLVIKTKEEKEFLEKITILELPLIENYDLMADKVLTTIKLAFENYQKQYKWFLLVDDDTFIYTNNLYKFIKRINFNLPFTYGYNFKRVVPTGYHSGGGGTLLTYEAMKRLYNSIVTKKCPYKDGYGDVALGFCSKISKVTIANSLDELGRERFHCLGPYDHYDGNFPDWLLDYATNKVQKGVECCSNESISFHYVTSEEMIRMSKSDNYLDLIQKKIR